MRRRREVASPTKSERENCKNDILKRRISTTIMDFEFCICLSLAVAVPHSVAALRFYEPFCSMLQKGFDFMRKKVSTRKICLLGVFSAITLILGIYATFRIGNQIKIPLKFITVFMTGILFGPISAGSVAAVADILNATLMPVGAFLPQITAVEFLCGAIYGLCFYKASENRAYYLRCIICALLQLLIALTVMSFVLWKVGYFPGFYSATAVRFPAAIISFALQMLVMCGGRRLVFELKKFISKDDLR